ncbi:MAG: helix-turn-helix transcriptional regulator [Clostridia bacterium]|nr:helix-turn-helix transcriptional regulator [Clostridia bacterium]
MATEPMTKLKEMREAKGWTQQYLAYEMHTTRQAISSWEQGTTEPQLKSLKRLAEVFSCKVDDII